jgi:hypothetical protein
MGLAQSPAQKNPQSLLSWLAYMELRTDHVDRRNPIFWLIGEDLGCPLLKRIRDARAIRPTARYGSGTADDHHEQLLCSDQSDRQPRRDCATDRAMAQAVRHVRGNCRRDAQAKQPP